MNTISRNRILKTITSITLAVVVVFTGFAMLLNPVPVDAASYSYQMGVSTSHAGSGSCPNDTSFYEGKSLYINFLSSDKIKTVKFYLDGEWLQTIKANNFLRFAYIDERIKPSVGDHIAKVKYTTVGGKTNTISLSFTVNKSKNKVKFPTVGEKVSNSTASQCVGYVRDRAAECGFNVSIRGNANTWYSAANKSGYATSATPIKNSIACFNGGSYGHVIYIEAYDASTKTVYFSEGNCSAHTKGTIHKLSLNKFKAKSPGGYQGCIILK